MGNNSTLSFWYDKQSKLGSLQSLIQGSLTFEENGLMVKDAIRNGQWGIPYLSLVIPTHLLLPFKAILIKKALYCTDILSQDGNAKGIFDSNHAYKLALDEDRPHFVFEGKQLWKLDTLPYLWKCLHNSLIVNATLHHRCISDTPCCLTCPNTDETCSHVLRDCLFARNFQLTTDQARTNTTFFYYTPRLMATSECH